MTSRMDGEKEEGKDQGGMQECRALAVLQKLKDLWDGQESNRSEGKALGGKTTQLGPLDHSCSPYNVFTKWKKDIPRPKTLKMISRTPTVVALHPRATLLMAAGYRTHSK